MFAKPNVSQPKGRSSILHNKVLNLNFHITLIVLMMEVKWIEIATGLVCREYLDNLALFQGCSDKFLDAACVLLREVQVYQN